MERVSMQLSDWFTVVTILVAVLAFYKAEERKLLKLKIGFNKLFITALVLFLVLPFLLFYDSRIGFYFPSSFTLLAADWAFFILISTVGYWFWWFSKKLHHKPVTPKIIDFYREATNTLPIEELLRLFLKYESSLNNSSTYVLLVLHKPFFQGTLQHNPALLMNLLKEVEVDVLLEHKLPVLIRDEMLVFIAAEKRKGTLSVYNQEPLTVNSERDGLVLFDLLEGYFSMLNKCIDENKFGTKGFGMKNFFLPNIFEEILKSIQVNPEINLNTETPTYNHQLLNNILAFFGEILSDLEKEKESYEMVVKHFAPIYSDCTVGLFERFDVVKAYYLKIQFKSFLDTYFNDINGFTGTIDSLNENLVDKLTKVPGKEEKRKLFDKCWMYADDDIFVNGINIPKSLKDKREKFIRDVVNKILNKNSKRR